MTTLPGQASAQTHTAAKDDSVITKDEVRCAALNSENYNVFCVCNWSTFKENLIKHSKGMFYIYNPILVQHKFQHELNLDLATRVQQL